MGRDVGMTGAVSPRLPARPTPHPSGRLSGLFLAAALALVPMALVARLLPDRFFYDGRAIQRIAAGEFTPLDDRSYLNVGRLYGLLGTAERPWLAALLGMALAIAVLQPAMMRGRGTALVPAYLLVGMYVVTAGAYLTQYSKDVWVLPVVLMVLVARSGRGGESTVVVAVLIYAVSFREYWFLILLIFVALRIVTAGGLRASRVVAVVVAAVAGVTVVAPTVLGTGIQQIRAEINLDRVLSGDATTAIDPPSLGSGLWADVAENLVMLVELVVPVPLLGTGSPLHAAYAAAIVLVWAMFLRAAFVGPGRIFDGRRARQADVRAVRAVLMVVAVVTTQSLFEPDYGSYLRHLTPVLPLIVLLAVGRVGAPFLSPRSAPDPAPGGIPEHRPGEEGGAAPSPPLGRGRETWRRGADRLSGGGGRMPQDRSTQVGLSEYVGSLRRRWYLVALGLVLGLGAALGYAQLATPVYTANTQLFVSTSGATDLSGVVQGGQFSRERTASYAQLVTGRELAARVIDDLGLDMTLGDFSGAVSAQVLPETVILDVDVRDPSPERAVAIAESIGTEFRELVQSLETTASSAAPPVQVSVVAAPVLPTQPSAPQPAVALLAGVVLGVLLGGLVAVVRDRLDTSVQDELTAAEASGAPVLGLVPDDAGASAELTDGPLAEAFRMVRTNLQFVTVDSQPRVIMVTSSSQAEGKTTTAIHLAQVLAQAGRRVLLVEGDLRRPRVTKYLGLVSGAGVTNLLTKTVDVPDVLQPVGDGRMTVLGAGPTPPNPSEMLVSEAMARLLGQLADDFDLVLVDAPPLLPVADAAGLAALCDGVVFCIRWGVTSRGLVERSRALLDRAGATVLGTVLTFVPRRSAGEYAYDYADATEDAVGLFGHLRRRRPAPTPPASSPAVAARPRPRVRPEASHELVAPAPTRDIVSSGVRADVDTPGGPSLQR